ncbi:arginyl-tRNA--protein transferase 1-like [Babylonia areolata]|uniref:arginyl-tRNA--protein transferase 1-like n=1 Tax=Babylonia areolata TaxID=304850 RepID=UPI003FD4E2DB
MARRERSIVEYFAGHEGYRCGYCGSSDTNYSHGMWAHSMTVQDYQDLIDRGWRRSGKYCYKPTMNATCCPMYTIRCDALRFRLSKSHKKVLKRVNRYLITGEKPGGKGGADMMAEGPGGDSFVPGRKSDLTLSADDVKNDTTVTEKKTEPAQAKKKAKVDSASPAKNAGEKKKNAQTGGDGKSGSTTASSQGTQSDTGESQCRKARQLRLEKRMKKTGETLEEIKAKNKATSKEGKSLEDFLNEPEEVTNPAHRLEVRVIRTKPPSAASRSSFSQSHELFKKYQMTIHREGEHECTKEAFQGFLVDSPLEPNIPKEDEVGRLPEGYGSFHQHYLLDGKLIAVGVIDILPSSVSSVYLYYDPDYSFLSLGTYSALRELAFVRELQKIDPAVAYYYMGFYIHSCPKMRYKGQYFPSYLVCPEAYTWVPIERCVPKLNAAPYARLDDSGKVDPDGNVNLDQVLVLHDGEAMLYEVYRFVKKNTRDQKEVKEYAGFVGMTCARRMLLFRK